VTNWGQRVVERVLSEQTLEDALLDLSNRSDIVADPFLGSGSTLIAAEKTGRVCRGVELDPLYVDVMVRRYEAATGNPAVLIETGEPFDLLAGLGQGKQRRSRLRTR
jgi:DNA methylase